MEIGKVVDSSRYWLDWDYDSINYSIIWDKNKTDVLIENQVDFLLTYTLLTFKYGVCVVPYEGISFSKLKVKIEEIVESNSNSFPKSWIPLCFNSLYKELFYIRSSYLFIGEKPRLSKIVNAEFLLTPDQINEEYQHNGAYPVKIEFFQERIIINFTSNAFLPILYGQKTGWATRYIDNSQLAYLNGTRFNSFLRDLKILCIQYGASDVSFDKDYLDYMEGDQKEVNSIDGILFNGEVIYYEDVYELLPSEHKYKKFEEIKTGINPTGTRF